MMIRLLISLIFTMYFSNLAWANGKKVIGLSSGEKGSDYYTFAEDIKDMADLIDIKVFESKGSLDNIDKLINDPKIDLAITQYDALLFSVSKFIHAIDYLTIVFPLFSEEIHIIVQKNSPYTRLTDLDGKTISIGPKERGSWVSGRVILRKIGMDYIEFNLPPSEALKRLAEGQIEGIFVVGPAPTSNILNYGPTFQNTFKLIPINSPLNDSDYKKVYLTKEQYPWLDHDIQTYSITNVLITYDPEENKGSYIKSIANSIRLKFRQKEETGHKKWADLPGQRSNFEFLFYPSSQKYTFQN